MGIFQILTKCVIGTKWLPQGVLHSTRWLPWAAWQNTKLECIHCCSSGPRQLHCRNSAYALLVLIKEIIQYWFSLSLSSLSPRYLRWCWFLIRDSIPQCQVAPPNIYTYVHIQITDTHASFSPPPAFLTHFIYVQPHMLFLLSLCPASLPAWVRKALAMSCQHIPISLLRPPKVSGYIRT